MPKFEKGQSGNPAGKKPGTQNKITKALKEAILEATENAGCRIKPGCDSGTVAYLEHIAIQEPAAFCSLLGKVYPSTLVQPPQGQEPEMVIRTKIVWPVDKEGRIVKPSWADKFDFGDMEEEVGDSLAIEHKPE